MADGGKKRERKEVERAEKAGGWQEKRESAEEAAGGCLRADTI